MVLPNFPTGIETYVYWTGEDGIARQGTVNLTALALKVMNSDFKVRVISDDKEYFVSVQDLTW